MPAHSKNLTYTLNPLFNKADKVEFLSSEGAHGKTLKGHFITRSGQKFSIPDVCEPEGGDPGLQHAYTVKGVRSYFLFTCVWSIEHSGIGLKGKQYETFIYSGQNLTSLKLEKNLSTTLSGYEGNLESGERSYAWYSLSKLARKKLLELETGNSTDSIVLAHEIILLRLKDFDYDAVRSYLSPDRLKNLLIRYPISSTTVVVYNDLGFALDVSGNAAEAYEILKKVESIFPHRTVLKLNIADILWQSDKLNARLYYDTYLNLMRRSGKSKLIPLRAFERSNADL